MMHWLTKNPIAHRGLHNNITVFENTKESFQAAIVNNFAIECDVSLTLDYEVAVFHDKTLKRLCQVDADVSSLTMNELRKQSIKGSSSNIISLDEMLHVVNANVPIIVEIKGNFTPFIEERIQEIIRSYHGPIALKSFNLESIKWLIKFLPFIPKGLVIDNKNNNSEFVLDMDIDFVSCDVNIIESELIAKLKAKQIPIITWTINSKDKQKKAANFADNIIFENIEP